MTTKYQELRDREKRIGGRMREFFDRERAFLAVKNFSLNGKLVEGGALIDKTKINTRRLRQMYDQRLIRMTDAEPIADSDKPRPPQKPHFELLSLDGLKLWLEENGHISRPRTKLPALVKIAEKIWKEKIDGFIASNPVSGPDSGRVSKPANDGNTAKE